MTVCSHKTVSSSGPAKVVLEANDRRLIKKYINRVRRVLDPNDSLDQLLVLHGPKPVSNAHSMLQALGKKYAIYIPSSTDLRKAGSTSAWKNLSHGQVSTLARSISHGLQTSSKHYRASTSGRDATKAFIPYARGAAGAPGGRALCPVSRSVF